MDLTNLFTQISTRMRADFEESRTAFTHSGLKGTAFEETVKKFLGEYLPQRLELCGGQLVDATGDISRQLDLILFDRHGTPTLKRSGDSRVIPVECAYSVIEVKAMLSTSELRTCFENMQSVRKLKKTAYLKPSLNIVQHVKLVYGSEWDHWPINYFIFAIDSIELPLLCKNLYDLQQEQPIHERIDLICVLNRGVVLNTNATHTTLSPLPDTDTRIGFKDTEHSLLLFYALISQVLSQASMPPFMFTDYLKEVRF